MARRRNPWIPELHPRDSKGRFTKRGGGESTGSWQRAVSNMAAPGVRASRPRRGELPGGARSVADLMRRMKSEQTSWRDKDTADRLHGYFDRTTSIHDHESGLRITLIKVQPLPNGEINLRYQVYDKDGFSVGFSDRQWKLDPTTGDVTINHSYFELGASVRGGGLAARWNRNNEDVYRANGATEITLNANISVGGYAWAKQGYDFEKVESMIQVEVRARNRLADGKHSRNTLEDYEDMVQVRGVDAAREIFPDGDIRQARVEAARYPAPSPGLQRRLEDLRERSTLEHWEAGTAPTPLEWAMLGWTPGATTWLGKEILLGSSWDGVKYL